MAKKSKGNRPSHVKHAQFDDENISSLEDHVRQGKRLIPPLATLPNGRSMSWAGDALNEVLWAALIRANTDQKETLALFRYLVSNARENLENRQETFLTHSVLSTFSDNQFDIWVRPLLENKKIKDLLSSLLFIDCLPDIRHWQRHLNLPEPEQHSQYLTKAISACLDHQSQESTDIRWLKLVYFIVVCERLHIPEHFVEELRLYPDYGDQRAVRPSIRSLEMSLRTIPAGQNVIGEVPVSLVDKIPKPWGEDFWAECLKKTPCIPGKFIGGKQDFNQEYMDQFLDIYRKLSEHFLSTLTTTSTDSRKDSTFGIVFYCINLGVEVARSRLTSSAGGRILLRTVVEGLITLKYLSLKDDTTIWQQFRNYGTGQSKLSFLKNLREENLPSFVNLEDLQQYANEDYWQEFTEINLKSWSQLNLREMSEEAGIKNFYDKYYDWSSGFVHGHWGAIRDTCFRICLNPAHRYHRIPLVPRVDMPDVLSDMGKIINLMLDIVEKLYPSFKPRVKHPQKNEAAKAK